MKTYIVAQTEAEFNAAVLANGLIKEDAIRVSSAEGVRQMEHNSILHETSGAFYYPEYRHIRDAAAELRIPMKSITTACRV